VQTNLDQTAFEPARELKSNTQKTILQWRDGQPQIAAVGLAHPWETNPIVRVIGEDPLRQFLVPFPDGRFQTLEASYDPHRNEWFDSFGGEDRQPGEWGHWTGRGMNWNSMCAACHNTRVQKNYDAATDAYSTTMAEPTVSCEACHGPLGAHVDWQKAHGGASTNDPAFPKLSRRQVFDLCGSCHARRTELTGNFQPGDDFSDHFDLATVDASELFYPDGQIHDEDYEFSAFLGSRMQQAGLTCLDCHPRSLHIAKLHGNALCLQCHHGGFPKAPVINPTEHSHHAATSAGNECVGCHMPVTVYMQRHPRHDHGFTIPDPLLTKQFGVPNACNRCHAEKETEWALKRVEAWYGDKMQRPTRDRAQIIARARAGEAGAQTNLVRLLTTEEIPYWRAVIAGLLGNWAADANITPVLLRDLEDTNALVRGACVRALEPLVSEELIASALQKKLSDPARNVRVASAWALRATLDTNSPAGRDLQAYLEYHADQPGGQLQLGLFDFARGNADPALVHYQKAAAWDASSAASRRELAVVYSALNRPQDAVKELQAAGRLAPREAEYQFELGLAWNESGDLTQAQTALEAAVKLAPNNAPAWYNLGLAREAGGQSANALEALQRAEVADASDPRPPYARATILARQGKLEEARVALRSALKIQPDFSAALELLHRLSPP
jgi:tetratricopeptide (TPR) repeat protein